MPLRLGAAGTDAVLESLPVHCTHHDAFRFFTPPPARATRWPRPGPTRSRCEQPGCLHATMDLYKWAYKLAPATPSELLADCFALAVEVRELDMRASPYDLAALGYAPVRDRDAGRAGRVRPRAGRVRRAGGARCGERLLEPVRRRCRLAVWARSRSRAGRYHGPAPTALLIDAGG